MPKEIKVRQCKLDYIREILSPEQDAELMAIANQPNPQLKKIQELLLSWGYEASLNAISTWYKRHLRSGVKAYELNQKLQDYSGINVPSVLEKLLVDAISEIDNITEKVSVSTTIDDKEYLRALPGLRRTAIQAIETYGRVNQLQEKQEIEFSGALKLANALRETFKNTEFELPLETALEGAMALFNYDDS